MKYPQSVPMTRDVEDWLESELDARGIDAAVYTRHILPLLQPQRHPSKGVWSGGIVEAAGLDLWRFWDDEAVKRLNVVRCLMSASNQKCDMDIESLVDELCAKLKEIQSGAAGADNVFPKCDCTPPFAADLFGCGLAPLREGLERGGEALPTTGWTRGLLRASLDQPNPGLFYDDTINIEDCFSIMYCGQQKSFGQVGSLFPDYGGEDVKRLYERAADPAPTANLYDCFFNSNFSPGFFAFGGVAAKEPQPQLSWSLGGVITNSLQSQVNNCLLEPSLPSTEKSASDQLAEDPPTVCPPEEEDLLTSDRTHFRPIPMEEAVRQPPKYADGTTFVISTELDDPPFKRSESGTLFLNNGKYLEFKKEEETGKDEVSHEFIPKFRMRQSNEKFCQTDDLGEIPAFEKQVVPAPSPTESDLSSVEFYFPGDDELAHDIDSEDFPAEDEIVRIVAGRWHDVEDAIDNSLMPPDPELVEITELENRWGSDVSELGNRGWINFANTNADESDYDNQMDGDTSDTSTGKPAWPILTKSIWNPKTTGYSCQGCQSQHTDQLLGKSEWWGIWGPPLCDCKESKAKKTAPTSTNMELKSAVSDAEIAEKINVAHDAFVFGNAEKVGFSTIWSSTTSLSTEEKCAEQGDDFDFSSFGPFCAEDKQDDAWHDFDYPATSKWPRLGAFRAYLEEKRARAFEMIQRPIWSPVNLTSDEKSFGRQPRELRGLWSPLNGPENHGNARLPPSEWREVWSPVLDVSSPNAMNARAAAYTMLRDELSEDGDQLLSDLSCLHLEQIVADEATDASDVLEDDSFPTAPPSPDWDKSSRFVGIQANWSREESAEDSQTLNERSYNPETARKERKRRNSSSQKVCEQYLEGECRRPHCRFLHCDAAVPCPFFDDASCLKGDACLLSHAPRLGRDIQRAFTL